MKLIKGYMFRSYNGRHFLSRWVRKVFERNSIRRYIGHIFMISVVIGIVVTKTISIVFAQQELNQINSVDYDTIYTPPVKTNTTVQWPVEHPHVTQKYTTAHLGIDIQDKKNKNIYPIDEGYVLRLSYTPFGYGKHIMIVHPNGRTSIYAHLKKVYVRSGQKVERTTILGIAGKTGWATGVHLHLEVYQNGERINPITILPRLK